MDLRFVPGYTEAAYQTGGRASVDAVVIAVVSVALVMLHTAPFGAASDENTGRLTFVVLLRKWLTANLNRLPVLR
jgi:hypothetical protein